MRLRILILLLIIVILPESVCYSQKKSGNICYINDNRIYFQLDNRWSEKEKKEISALFSLDSMLIEIAFLGDQVFNYDSISWETKKIDANIIELSKQIEGNETPYRPDDVFLLDDQMFISPLKILPVFAVPKRYGLNSFAKEPNIKYTGDTARFFLPGYSKALKVCLSGSFNNWSTMQHVMKKKADGWVLSLRLPPGRYLYKFIVDGKWIHDPNNKLRESDGEAGFNSVFYCYNYVFNLKGYTEAKKVFVTGSFNGWKKKELRMTKAPGGWSFPLYLEEGTHAYKFIVDGTWLYDPENKIIRTDAFGNLNSFIGIGDTLIFRLKGYPNAKTVVLSGSFNAWSINELVMNKTEDGWELPYVLAAGNYEYKFIVDGKWMPDPENPVTTGSGDFTNSCISFKPNYTFVLDRFPDAESVIVTGSFNGWDEESYKMSRKGDRWICPVFLKPGKYTYKFIVDGRWMIDPANEYWEENEYGTGNSVLWIEP